MKRFLSFVFFIINTFIVSLSQNFTISGTITDASSAETLINCSVYDSYSQKGTVSNNFGFYTLTLPKAKVNLLFSYIGHAPNQLTFNLQKDTVINIHLNESTVLEEITIIADKKTTGIKDSQMSAIEIPSTVLKTVPSLFGESDVLKSLQLIPGVQFGLDGSSGFYIRGGGSDENLFLLDGVPLYNVSHLGGFFSVFNTDAIKNVTLYKGSFPARFSGRLSSVVDVIMNDGNSQKLHGNVSVGLISSKINLEGPLFNNKTTFNISARKSYIDLLTKPLLKFLKKNDGLNVNAGYSFYDLNAKLSHKFSENDRFYLSFYMGNDKIVSDIQDKNSVIQNGLETDIINMNWKWGNLISAIRWNKVINNKLFMNTVVSYSKYNFNMQMGNSSTTILNNPYSETISSISLGYQSGIADIGTKVEFDYTPNPEQDIKFGAGITFHNFRPGISSDNTTSDELSNNDSVSINANIYTMERIIFVEDNWSICSFIKANIGLNYSAYKVQNSFYHSLQPRISIRALLSDKLTFKTGFASMCQYVHLLAYNNFSLPNDLWIPVTDRVKPMYSTQYSSGFYYNLMNLFEVSVEGYYKSMKNKIEYMDGASFFGSGTDWEDKIVSGIGWAYGVEFLIQKTIGKTTGWLGYTWSKTECLFNRENQILNNGIAFPAKYDRRNDLDLVVSHKFSDKFDIATTMKYSSGNYVTLALQSFKGFSEFDSSLPYFGARNNYQMPDFFKIDVGANFNKKLKHGERTWNISIYNITNQMNPFYLFVSSKKYIDPVTETVSSEKVFNKITLFPIIPSVSYRFKF